MIYMDYAATSPALPEVFQVMEKYYLEDFANASSLHEGGRRARAAVEQARRQTAALLHGKPSEIFFTSGGTESDNWALRGAFEKASGHLFVITTAMEHEAILRTCEELRRRGAEVRLLPPSPEGFVEAEQVEEAILQAEGAGYRQQEILVSVMAANNELGTLQPLAEIGALCRQHGCLFHTDAVQAVGHIPLYIEMFRPDLLSASAHKFGGPKGAGFLYIREGLAFPPLLTGGGQEEGLRSGTWNTPGIAGSGMAAELALRELPAEEQRLRGLRDRLRDRILREIPGVLENGGEPRLPGILNLAFTGISGEALLNVLDMKGVFCSAGSACAAGKEEISHVLQAIGCPEPRAKSSIRISIGRGTTEEETAEVFRILRETAEELRIVNN